MEEDQSSILFGAAMGQYISSSLDWKLGQILLKQKVEPAVAWNPLLQVTLTISSLEFMQEGAGLTSTLYSRVPIWTYSNGAKAMLNGQYLSLTTPGNLSVSRKWSTCDKINLELPINL